MKLTCGNCRYWGSESGAGEAACHRRSPFLLRSSGEATWPQTRSWNWCGEGQLREDAAQRYANGSKAGEVSK